MGEVLTTVIDTCHNHIYDTSGGTGGAKFWWNIPIADSAWVADTGFVRLEVAETRLAAVLAVAAVVVDDVAAVLVDWAATWTGEHFGSTVQAATVIDTL